MLGGAQGATAKALSPAAPPPAPKTQKVIEPALARLIQSPSIEPFEDEKRVLPNDAWYAAVRSPTNPTQFEINHYKVPNGRALIVLDFSFQPYRFSGVGAFESEPMEDRRLSGIMGYRFTVNNDVPAVINFQLEPVPSNFERQQFRPDPLKLTQPGQRTVQDFQRAQALSYGSAAGYGTGILPQRSGRIGSAEGPAAYLVTQEQSIVMAGIIYRPVPIPLAFVSGRIAGYLCSIALAKTLVEELRVQ